MIKAKSTLCTVLGIVGFIGTMFLTVKTTLVVKNKLDETEKEKGEPLTKKEIAKIAIRPAIAPTASAIATIASITGSRIIGAKTEATLASGVVALSRSYNKYTKAVEDVFGIEGEKTVKKHVALSKIAPRDDPEIPERLLFFLGYGYDDYFYATEEDIEKAEFILNRNLRTNGMTCINDFLESIGIEPVDPATGFYGWGSYELFGDLDDGWLTIETDTIENDNGETVNTIYFNSIPNEDFEENSKIYGDRLRDMAVAPF